MIKGDLFSDLEILEICQKANNEKDTNTVSDTLYFDKQKQSYRNKQLTSENIKTPHPNNIEKTLKQKQNMNLENLKRIMNEQKIALPPQRNIEWRTIKMEIN